MINKSEYADGGQGRVTPPPAVDAQTEEFFGRSEAEFGRPSTKGNTHATQQNFFEAENPMAGKGDNYERNAEHEEEFNPPPESDHPDGRSASTEGDIANHNPFNVASDMVTSKKA